MSTVTVGFADTVALGINYFPAKPAASGQGAAGDYALQTLYAGLPVRWNPCTEVTWAMSADSAAEEHERMAAAFDTASLATGLTFREVTAGEQAAVAVQLRSVPGDRVKGEGEMQFRSGGAARAALRGIHPGRYRHRNLGRLAHGDLPARDRSRPGYHARCCRGRGHARDRGRGRRHRLQSGRPGGLAQVGMAAGCLNRPTPPLDARVRTLGGTWRWVGSSPPAPILCSAAGCACAAPKDTSGIYIDMPLDTDANPTLREGAQYVRIAMPSDVCAPGAAPELVVANRNGSTVTPLSVTGCPTRATSG